MLQFFSAFNMVRILLSAFVTNVCFGCPCNNRNSSFNILAGASLFLAVGYFLNELHDSLMYRY